MPNKISHTSSPVQKRTLRVRANLVGSSARPRVTVFRSNRYITAQAIYDSTGTTLAAVSDRTVTKTKSKQTKTARATQVGEQLAQALQKKGVTQAVFDRGPYRYHGRVKAVAEALRAQGVQV